MKLSEDKKTIISCNKSYIGTFVIPDGVEVIKSSAFKDCIHIEEIIIPQSVLKIEYNAFCGCTQLSKINIPAKVTKIPSSCFKGCLSLNEINLHQNIYEIGFEAFENCRALRFINLNDKIKEIHSEAFKGCINLSRVSFPKNIESIDKSTFEGCQSIIEIRIPKKVRKIYGNAFAGCINLSVVYIESEDITISPTAFSNCHMLSRLYLANFNTNMVISAFPDSPNLNIVSPISDSSNIVSDQTTSTNEIHKRHSESLKYHSLYYRLFGMNITQMKWSLSLQNEKSFKEPIDSNWCSYKNLEQDLDYVLNLDWNESSGIGLILGHNSYRAIDVDIFSHFHIEVFYPENGIDGFINYFLNILGLPLDYPWVVRSGNGYGFHIIFRCDDIESTSNIDSISYQPNDSYQHLFERIELRWCDHLILPPSVHASGKQYYFREKKLPTSRPHKVSLSNIETIIHEFCGDRKFIDSNYKGRKLILTKVEKIISRHDSYLSPHDTEIDSLNWLESVNNAENLNTLALKYLFGDGVNGNTTKVIQLLSNNPSQSSRFNLVNLYACGFLKYDHDKYLKLFESLDQREFGEYYEFIESNWYKYVSQGKLYLFFDTETTGLPRDYNASYYDVENWPRLLQLSWIICDESKNIIKQENHIIQPDGFSIPEESVNIHGFSTEYLQEEGEDLNYVLDLFKKDLNRVNYIVGHNIDFDKNVIGAEYVRQGINFTWDKWTSLCTMKSTTNFCKIIGPYYGQYRYAKLQELHTQLFRTGFEGAHDAFYDILATYKCFWELRARGWANEDFTAING